MTPWELVKRSEHSHQRAVFAWANCAALYGMAIADQPEAYVKDEREKLLAGNPYLQPEPRPELARLFAVHNQGHGDKIRGNMARAEGVKPGVPDLMLPVPRYSRILATPKDAVRETLYHGLFIELKRIKLKGVAGGIESDIQAEWRAYLNGIGYKAVVAYGWQEAVGAIREYLR